MTATVSNESIQYIKGVGPRRAGQLERLGIRTVSDLLEHFPRRYQRVGEFRPIAQAIRGEEELQRVQGRIVAASHLRPRRGMHISKIAVQDDSGTLWAVWFNQPYVLDRLKTGRRVALRGKIESRYGHYQMTNPAYELDPAPDRRAYPWLPVYPATAGVSQHFLRSLVSHALNMNGVEALEEFLPGSLRQRLELPDRGWALANFHFPQSAAHFRRARQRLAFEELFLQQLALAYIRSQLTEKLDGIPHDPPGEKLADFYGRLPFRLTAAQRRVIGEILTDMARPRPMHRLLQGDVGAGKTIVAVAALWNAVINGYQGAMMAPTEILASQHYESISKLLSPWQVRVELLTGGMPAGRKAEILQSASQGQVDILVGTHALLEENVAMPRLSLVITDEQHRFGVKQRAKLAEKGTAPHVLVMTATPIPRTLALAFYGDLDVSILDGLPPGRRPVKTYWVRPPQRRRAYAFVKQQLEAGRQAYVVCPLIDDSADGELKAAVDWHRRLARAFQGFNVGLLHGRMPGAEKARVMDQFRQGQIQLLVATSLIEVGIDVPNATIMVIEDAHRFGLAQLHQLRGRVGRGRYQSYCFLMGAPQSEIAVRRLRVMEQTNDGFRVAEQDLTLRGPGEFLGTRQHGLPQFKVADLARDGQLLRLARKEAQALLAKDPELMAQEHALLRRRLGRLYSRQLNTHLDP